MNNRDIAGWIFRRARGRFRDAVPFSLALKLLQAVVVAPILAASLGLLLHRWGRASVGNFEIAEFLLSPPGLAAVVGAGAISLAGLYLELAGLIHLLAVDRLTWWQALLTSGQLAPRMIRLGLRQLLFFLLLAIPFLAAIAIVYAGLWHGRDLNGLIILKPPVFWTGLALASSLALVYVSLAGRWLLLWLLAVPAMLFDPHLSPAAALRWSADRHAGQMHRIGGSILSWLSLQVVLNLSVFAALRWLSAAVLSIVGESLPVALPTTAALLVAFAIIAAQLAVFSTLTFAGLVLALYRSATGHAGADEAASVAAVSRGGRSPGWVFLVLLLILTAATSVLSHRLLNSVTLHDQFEITAHRAGATNAPENSLAALRQAILDRADWAEIDVQLTQDNALVVLHDIDLARIGGGNRRVAAVTFQELRMLDIGTVVDRKYAGEKVPTLEEMLATAGRDIRMNVELKPHGKADETALTERVVAAIRKAGMVNRCRICSQSYESLQVARRLEPSLPVGFIAATSIGDLARLEVDFLMVKSDLITRNLVDRAGARQVRIHAWTVNDPSRLAVLLDHGIDNVITDDPAMVRRRLEEIQNLTTIDRLLLRLRSELFN